MQLLQVAATPSHWMPMAGFLFLIELAASPARTENQKKTPRPVPETATPPIDDQSAAAFDWTAGVMGGGDALRCVSHWIRSSTQPDTTRRQKNSGDLSRT